MNSKVHIIEEFDDPDHFMEDNSSGLIIDRLQDGTRDHNLDKSDLIIDKAAFIVYMGGEKISFPKKEFELLLLLASNSRKVFKRDEILTHIWGKSFKPKDSRSLDVHIRMLRKKLKDQYITTVRGVGYKLEK